MSADSGRVLVSGASGPIGSALVPQLRRSAYQVVRLVRGKSAGDDQIVWDPAQPLSPQSVSGFDAVVHLAGESIVGRWTESKKRRILDSRVQGTRNLANAIANTSQPPRVMVSGSAIGYYGDRANELLREDSPPGQGFLPTVCREWEAATSRAQDKGIRVAEIRTGLVLSASGGALEKMLTPFRLGLGGRIGNGRQWWSWIHVQDMAAAIQHILKSNLSGPVNLTAPAPVTNLEFTKVLAAVLSRPAIFPVPAFAARLAFGQMGDELLLASQKVEPSKLLQSGYCFEYSDLRKALQEILKK